MALATITLSGPLITHANGSVSPGLPTNDVKKADLPIPQGYDNNFNYNAPSFHLAVLLGCLIPLAIFLIAYFIAAVRLIRWNKKVRHELVSEDSETGVDSGTAPTPLEPTSEADSPSRSHTEPPLMTGAGVEVPSETVSDFPPLPAPATRSYGDDQSPMSHAEEEEIRETLEGIMAVGSSGEIRDLGVTGTRASQEELPRASLLGGTFEPSETFKHIISHIPGLVDDNIPKVSSQVFAVVGWTNSTVTAAQSCFLGLHFGRGRQYPGETSYSATSHLLLRTPYMHRTSYNGIFSLRFKDSNNEHTGPYSLEPDPANPWTMHWETHLNHSMRGLLLSIKDTEDQMRVGSAKFRLMFWGAPQDLFVGSEALETPADSFNEFQDSGIGHSPIELGTIIFDHHWGFFRTRAPSSGERYFDYDRLIRNVDSGERNIGLGFILRWDDHGNVVTTASR